MVSMIFVKAGLQGPRHNDGESAVFEITIDATLSAAMSTITDKANLLWPHVPCSMLLEPNLFAGRCFLVGSKILE
jgi:hypothetical protein